MVAIGINPANRAGKFGNHGAKRRPALRATRGGNSGNTHIQPPCSQSVGPLHGQERPASGEFYPQRPLNFTRSRLGKDPGAQGFQIRLWPRAIM